MDKSWMQIPRWNIEYFMGMNKFLDFVFEKVGTHGKINCPCVRCSHRMWYDRRTVVDHYVPMERLIEPKILYNFLHFYSYIDFSLQKHHIICDES
ncbi:hypothetical protein QJS04_geneDACA015501 [Acorus gramineus]|uniref:Transposase-associated domain-containing protein n=1 Tax=Acorus gramineus TaxID=55184 RepID=A0AAV9AQ74_ACOGR|nr:hypothetical protein QJS04_geneDACA015501 [Acorus gramineus]